jgi:hypothetical protein
MNEVPVSLSRLGKIFWAYNWRITVYLVGFTCVIRRGCYSPFVR